MNESPYIRDVEYDTLTEFRKECVDRFGGILDIPTGTQSEELLRRYSGGKVLDVGAGANTPVRGFLKIDAPNYYSIDSDSHHEYTYRSIADVPSHLTFDLIVMSQVLEHLTVDDGIDHLRRAFSLLRSSAFLVASVPNAHHPIRYHSTVTHLTNWPYGDFYSVFRSVGFNVIALLRSNKFPPSRNPLVRWLVRQMCRQFRMDWCDTLILTAQRP